MTLLGPKKTPLKLTTRDKEILEFINDLKNSCYTTTIEDIFFSNIATGKQQAQKRLAKLHENGLIQREALPSDITRPLFYWPRNRKEPQNKEHHDLIARCFLYAMNYGMSSGNIQKNEILDFIKEPQDFVKTKPKIQPDVKIILRQTSKSTHKTRTITLYFEIERSHEEGIAEKIEKYKKHCTPDEPFTLLYCVKANKNIEAVRDLPEGMKVFKVTIEKLNEHPEKPEPKRRCPKSPGRPVKKK